MRFLVLTLLMLLCSTQVFALRCYTCNVTDNDDECKTVTECPSTSNFCKTAEIGEQIQLSCADTCDQDTSNNVWCCSTDECVPDGED
ncbi:uncharacterized protein LOC142995914 [Genypterus blacodes]|uniref:uncharacterized protein LOC142995914 n=1 Tax=Genypterus blacodes TaxID=154954 RepID=UPI003F7770DC